MKIQMIDSLVNNDYSVWLCRGLSKAGLDVELICTENRKNLHESFSVLPVSPEKGSGNSFFKAIKYFYYLIWLFAHLWRSKADIIHYQFFRRERLECLYFPLLRLLNRNLFFTAHNILPHEQHWIDYYLRYLVYKSASKIIVHTPRIRNRLLELYAIPAEKVVVMPAVKPSAGKKDIRITNELARSALGLAPDAKVLLFFGFIREYKGLDILLKAFEMAAEQDAALRLLIAGQAQSDELLKSYQSQIQAMKHCESVYLRAEFIPQDEVDVYFRAADALALPYRRIEFSGVVQEAFAYGLPVLATDVGNLGDLISPGINGYLSRQNSAEEFATIIQLAFQDREALALMGEAALALDRQHPGWQEIGLLSAELYRKAYYPDEMRA
jgi:D-inositol-3-phosphate glycosyltransferase